MNKISGNIHHISNFTFCVSCLIDQTPPLNLVFVKFYKKSFTLLKKFNLVSGGLKTNQDVAMNIVLKY